MFSDTPGSSSKHVESAQVPARVVFRVSKQKRRGAKLNSKTPRCFHVGGDVSVSVREMSMGKVRTRQIAIGSRMLLCRGGGAGRYNTAWSELPNVVAESTGSAGACKARFLDG